MAGGGRSTFTRSMAAEVLEERTLLAVDVPFGLFTPEEIAYMEAVVDLDGPAGKAVRFESTQGMLTSAP